MVVLLSENKNKIRLIAIKSEKKNINKISLNTYLELGMKL